MHLYRFSSDGDVPRAQRETMWRVEHQPNFEIACGYLSECHGSWVSRCGRRPVQRERLSAPNTDCEYVCQKSRMQLTCDLREFTYVLRVASGVLHRRHCELPA
eukprot:730442_1